MNNSICKLDKESENNKHVNNEKYKFQVSDEKTVNAMVLQVLDNKVYVNRPNWALKLYLESCLKITNHPRTWNRKKRPRYVICNAYNENKVIGTTLLVGNMLFVYVKPEHRRNAVGSTMIKRLVTAVGQRTFIVFDGVSGSQSFYRKNNIS